MKEEEEEVESNSHKEELHEYPQYVVVLSYTHSSPVLTIANMLSH